MDLRATRRPARAHGAGLRIAGDDLVGFVSGDVDDDGRDDLVWLIADGAADGSAPGRAQRWRPATAASRSGTTATCSCRWAARSSWSATSMPTAGPTWRVLGRGETEGTAQLVVLKKKPGDGFLRPGTLVVRDRRTWPPSAAAWAGDVSGDGRADLIVREHPESGGVRIKTAVTGSPLPLRPAAHGQPAQSPTTSRSIRPRSRRCRATPTATAGRTSCCSRRATAGRASTASQGQALGAFKRVPLWTAPEGDPRRRRRRRGSAPPTSTTTA